MTLITRSCGVLVGVVWLAFSAFGFFFVYLLLTFYIFSPVPMIINFRENRVGVISSSLVSVAFLAGGIGVLLRRTWARGFSIFLCALGALFAASQALIHQGLSLQPTPVAIAAFVLVTLSILGWLFSRSGRTYFRHAVQPA